MAAWPVFLRFVSRDFSLASHSARIGKCALLSHSGCTLPVFLSCVVSSAGSTRWFSFALRGANLISWHTTCVEMKERKTDGPYEPGPARMDYRRTKIPVYAPALGCTTILLTLLLLFLMPLILVDVMRSALERLHLSPPVAVFAVLFILVGGLVNIPIYRISRTEDQLVDWMGVYGLWGFAPLLQRVRRETIVAVNVGGCVIPCLLAVWQVVHMARTGSSAFVALFIVAIANIAVCFRIARPVEGIGIMMPGLMSPLVSVTATWLIVPVDSPHRVCVAFVAGVLGPLVGADLLHLKDITRVSTGMLSIGGAGTFDGIVLSGVLAALLA